MFRKTNPPVFKMPPMRYRCPILITLVAFALMPSLLARANKVTLDENGVLEIDGKKTFVLSVSLPPPPCERPDGRDAFAVLRKDGLTFCASGRRST